MRLPRGLGALVVLVLLSLTAVHAVPHPSADMTDLPVTLTMPAGVLPEVVHHAGPATLAAYQAALEHPDVLAAVPCLCGCQESLGHENNLDCYIARTPSNGNVTYALHGVNCGVCQAITREALNGAQQGLSRAELRALIMSHFGGTS